ncbi:MAG: hypothetical protein KBA28_13580 [Syntrophaceae bacterium]|nr:hypothetical protein [Syntrophaceae bacterium]
MSTFIRLAVEIRGKQHRSQSQILLMNLYFIYGFFNFDDIHIDFFEYVREIVRQGIRSGELEPGRDDDMALLYIGATYGAIEDLICDHPIIIDRYQLKRIINLLFRGIETKHEKAQ